MCVDLYSQETRGMTGAVAFTKMAEVGRGGPRLDQGEGHNFKTIEYPNLILYIWIDIF